MLQIGAIVIGGVAAIWGTKTIAEGVSDGAKTALVLVGAGAALYLVNRK